MDKFEFKVSNPQNDETEVAIRQPVQSEVRGHEFELPLREMKRQELKAQQGKRGVEKSIREQKRRTAQGDAVRAIYDNRNHPG